MLGKVVAAQADLEIGMLQYGNLAPAATVATADSVAVKAAMAIRVDVS